MGTRKKSKAWPSAIIGIRFLTRLLVVIDFSTCREIVKGFDAKLKLAYFQVFSRIIIGKICY